MLILQPVHKKLDVSTVISFSEWEVEERAIALGAMAIALGEISEFSKKIQCSSPTWFLDQSYTNPSELDTEEGEHRKKRIQYGTQSCGLGLTRRQWLRKVEVSQNGTQNQQARYSFPKQWINCNKRAETDETGAVWEASCKVLAKTTVVTIVFFFSTIITLSSTPPKP